ncbi:hypothetical protein ACN3XK_72190 [Actinomadura welshii]
MDRGPQRGGQRHPVHQRQESRDDGGEAAAPDDQRRIGLAIDALDTQITTYSALAKAAEIARAALADDLVNGLLATGDPLKGES